MKIIFFEHRSADSFFQLDQFMGYVNRENIRFVGVISKWSDLILKHRDAFGDETVSRTYFLASFL